ncbi:protein CASC3 [Tribolium madens]|uniref:protein CASC3 n=1 Tax=Tribolium madens TaxID=41895 RepID=UPI001CF74FA5|nr:protein CASC3 [Tribolium madens]
MEESVVVSATAPQTVENISQEKTRIDAEESHKSPNESEYDSAGSYSDEEQAKVRSRTSREHTDSETEDSVGLERESGDGQESLPTRKVDDDEDKKNPQYIPKRGTFYEHDDRTADDEQTADSGELEKEKEQKKKVWQDKKERWSHDRFNDSEQAPKSRAELVAIYGYDIRNEEGPPRARRRRRYGRGPNKYTRNWEDEDAYSKPPLTRKKKPLRKPNQGEDFPPLNRSNNKHDSNQENPQDSRDYEEKTDQYQAETNGNTKDLVCESFQSPSVPPESNRMQQRVGSGRVVKPKREIKDSDYRGFTTKTRQVRNMKTDQKVVPKSSKKDDFIQSQNFTNKNNNIQDLERDLSKLNVQDGVHKGGKHGGQRQGSVPPRLQSEQKGSKRYSSIRQRSLPESATPPFSQHSNYYSNEFNQAPNQVTIHQNAQIHPSTTQVPQIAPPPLPPIAQVPVTAAPILQAPPQFAPPFAQAPPFLQPAPPPFLPQQTPQIINYVPGQPQFSQGYQGYQQQFNPVTQPELYQPQTGITYYSTDQQVTQRAAPLKRPKAAIPIVAPPPIDLKGRVKEDDASSNEGYVSTANDGQTGDSGSAPESNLQVQQ